MAKTLLLAILFFISIYFGDTYPFMRPIHNVCAILLIILTAYKYNPKVVKRFKWVNIPLVAYNVVYFIAGYLNKDIHFVGDNSATFFNTLRSIVYLLSFAYFLEYYAYYKKLPLFFKSLLKVIFVALFFVDLYALAHRPTADNEAETLMIIANKFGVCYLHLIAAALLWCLLDFYNVKKKNLYMLGMLFVCGFMSIWLYCSTTLGGTMLLTILYFGRSLLSKIVTHPIFVLSGLILATIFVFYIEDILANPYVIYFIEDVLDEDSTLTGRTLIYEQLYLALGLKPWFGWGADNAANIVISFVGYGNAQNGILHNLLTYGAVGLTIFILMNYLYTKIYHQANQQLYPLYSLIFVYILMSTVEVDLGNSYVIILLYLVVAKYYYLSVCSVNHKIIK